MARITNIFIRIMETDIESYISSLVLKKYNSGLQIPLSAIVVTRDDFGFPGVDCRIMWGKSLDVKSLDFAIDTSGWNNNTYLLSDLLKSRGYI